MEETKDTNRKIDIETEEQLHTADAQQQDADAQPEADAQTDVTGEEQTEDPLAQAQRQADEMKDKYLRTLAEFDNYKKRTLKEKTELILNGGAKTVSAILPVLDDFERAMADKSEDPQAIKEGITNIYNKFVKSLESLGVKKIDTADKDFDTDYHEAVAMVPGMGDDKKGKVIDCLQTGYTMNDKVIRHAKVAVGQ